MHDVIVSIRFAKDCSQTPLSLIQQVTFIVRNSLLVEMLSRRILIRHWPRGGQCGAFIMPDAGKLSKEGPPRVGHITSCPPGFLRFLEEWEIYLYPGVA